MSPLTKHTPGPWSVGSTTKQTNVDARLGDWWQTTVRVGAARNAGNCIAIVYMGGAAAVNKEAAAVEANARLIAASPDLLAACEAALNAIENADLGGEVLWVRPPHQAAAVHETASERLAAAIRLAKEGANA